MFLTERQGGSDVGANTTVAVQDGDEWRLTGEKHFCSNVDAEVFIVLARPEGAPPGSRGLATFIVPRILRRRIAERVHDQAAEAEARHRGVSRPPRSRSTTQLALARRTSGGIDPVSR